MCAVCVYSDLDHDEFMRQLGVAIDHAIEAMNDLTCRVTPLSEIPAALGGTLRNR